MTDWLNRCHFGDVRALLRRMAADGVKVQTIVTSPPYWGLRSYLPAGHPDKAHEIGSEPTLREFIDGMVEVFELCRQVLADDGTAWVNMGDAYAGSWGAQSREHVGKHASNISALSANQAKAAQIRASGTGSLGRTPGLKSKDLMMQPHRLAIALQDAGWWVRQDIVWHKPNPMPESTKDRCTKAHEYIFLLSKSERYYFDQDAIRTPLSAETKAQSFDTMDYKARDKYKMPDGWNTAVGAHGSCHPDGREKGRSARDSFKREGSKREQAIPGQSVGTHRPDRSESAHRLDSANKRSVWTVATEAYPGSHFATFPSKLIEPCILAGAPAGGIVLDPFFGSGTTGEVAQHLGRQFIGIELNEANEPLQRERLRQPSLNLEAA